MKSEIYPPKKLRDIQPAAFYRGDGNHGIRELETLVKERNEEIHRLRLLAQQLEEMPEILLSEGEMSQMSISDKEACRDWRHSFDYLSSAADYWLEKAFFSALLYLRKANQSGEYFFMHPKTKKICDIYNGRSLWEDHATKAEFVVVKVIGPAMDHYEEAFGGGKK